MEEEGKPVWTRGWDDAKGAKRGPDGGRCRTLGV
jgi:hypothetical protein